MIEPLLYHLVRFMKGTASERRVKATLHVAIFLASCQKHFTCHTPFIQPAMAQNNALRVARKVKLSSTFCNIASQVAKHDMSIALQVC